MKFGIVIFPSKQLQDIANSLRKRYDSHFALIPPHITLREAFESNEEDIKNIITDLKNIANEAQPFSLTVYKYSSFTPANNTIFMGIKKTEQLLSLQKKLNSGSLAGEEKYPFVPHLTIGQDLDDDEFHDILGRLRMKEINYEEVCESISLLTQSDNGTWTVYETFLLGKDC